MRTLFIICTAVTLLQIFDVSIKGVLSAAAETKPVKSAGVPVAKPKTNKNTGPDAGTVKGTGKPNPTAKPKTANPDPTANPTTANPTTANPDPTAPGPENSDPGTNPNEDDSAEAEPPKTINESARKVVKTMRKMATNQGVNFFNGVTGFLKKSGSVLNFFGNFLRDRSSKVKDVAKQSLDMVGSFSDSSTRGASHLLNSGKTIATQGGKELYSSLQKGTKLVTNVTKLGGTLASTPMSIAGDVVGTISRVAKIPSKLSKTLSNKAIKPMLSYLGSDSDEQPENEEDEEGAVDNPDPTDNAP